jgi:RHS repeat-associated protein
LYQYDILGNLVKLTDNQSNTTQITYDSLGRKIKLNDPVTGTWLYEYDSLGNLVKQTDSNNIIGFTYDALNRLITKKDLKNNKTLATYIYDDKDKPYSIGRLSRVIDSASTTEFYYDKYGREIKTTKTIDNHSYTIKRDYDSLNRLIKLTYPDDYAIYYDYNNLSQIRNIFSDNQLFAGDINYNPTGQITSLLYGNGDKTIYEYNSLNQRLTHKRVENLFSKESLQDLAYTYDNIGNITQIKDNLNNKNQSFKYDDLNRLTQASGEYGTINYQYDTLGNIIKKGDTQFNYSSSNPYKLLSLNTPTQTINLTYDANGNITKKGSQSFKYDVENRLIEVADPNSTTTLTYDSGGGRIKKKFTVNSEQSTEIVYIGSLFEIQFTDNSPQSTVKHIFLGSQRIASIKTMDYGLSTTNYYHQDHLGSTSLITDNQGRLLQRITYKPFGEIYRIEQPANRQTSQPVNYYYTGKQLDETGLYYYGARYYDPQIARFTQPDTIIQAPYDSQSLNRYTYCRNNPINLVDPTGNFWWFIPIVIGSVIGGVTAAITGQDIGQGFLSGAISGACFGFVGSLGLSGISHTIAHFFAGAVSGSIISTITGTDPGLGALIGGFSAGLGSLVGNTFGFLKEGFLPQLTRRVLTGAIVGGTVSEILGGRFSQGARQGALTSAIAYTCNEWLHGAAQEVKEALNNRLSKTFGPGGFYDDLGIFKLTIADLEPVSKAQLNKLLSIYKNQQVLGTITNFIELYGKSSEENVGLLSILKDASTGLSLSTRIARLEIIRYEISHIEKIFREKSLLLLGN